MEKKWFQKEKTIGRKEPLINNSPVVKSSPIVKDIPVKKNTQLTKKILIAVVLFISLGLFFLIIASEEGFFENILNKIKEIGGFGGNSSSNDSGSSSSSSSSSSSGGGSSCGDGTCNSNENGISCPSDCVTECNDGSDNDNDGDIDLDDSGCANSNDDTESSGGSSSGGSSGGSSGSGSGGGSSCGDGTCDSDEDGALCPSDCVTECNDGDDDDGDGWIDLVDPGCTDENDDDESNADMGFQCSNNADDDGDGLTDGEDPMCTFWMDDDEFSECNDGVDNDGDGGEDYNLNNLSGDTGCDGYNDDSENSEVKSPLTKFASSSKYNWPLASTLSNNLEVLYRSDGTTLQMLNLSLLNSQTLPPITQIVMKEVDIYSSTMDLKEIGNSLFICSGDFGLHSIDSNLESTPSLIDIHERELWCSSLAVANLGNEELLIALWSGFDDNEVRIYNSTTKNLLGSVLINKANGTDHEGIGWDIEVGDSNAYIALGTSGIIQINWENVINGNSPNLLQGPLAITNPSYDRETKSLLKVRDLSINEGILYAAANAQGLIEINLSDPWSSSMNKKIHLQENFLIDRYPTRVKAITDNNQNTLVAIETVKNPNYGEWGPYVMYGEILWNSLNPFPEGDLDDLDNTNHNFERGSSLGGLVILEKQNNNAQFQEVASGASTATTPGIKTLEFHQIGNDFFAYNERPFIYKFTRNSSNNLQNATISGGDEVLQGHGFYIQGKKSKIKSDVLIATCDGGPHSIQKINSTPPKFSIIPGTYDLKYRFGLWSGARWVTSL